MEIEKMEELLCKIYKHSREERELSNSQLLDLLNAITGSSDNEKFLAYDYVNILVPKKLYESLERKTTDRVIFHSNDSYDEIWINGFNKSPIFRI